jgi:hypothetical protein
VSEAASNGRGSDGRSAATNTGGRAANDGGSRAGGVGSVCAGLEPGSAAYVRAGCGTVAIGKLSCFV